MGTFGRHLGNCASALFVIGLCVSCGSAGEGDYIQLHPPEGGASGSGGGGAAGSSGSSHGGAGGTSDDADGGGAGGSEESPDGGVQPGFGCQVSFVTPAAGAGSLRLGRADDVDGSACGSEFATGVRIASNARSVTLFTNGTTNSGLTQDVDGLQSWFPNVQLSNTGSTANSLRAVATMPDGRTCEATLDTEIFVDCDMPSCTIQVPSGSEYLNSDDNLTPSGGFHTDFEVGTDLENAGQVVLLTLDGDFDNRLSGEVLDETGFGIARFANVGLSEGRRLAQAECRDAAGNVAHSSLAEWTVDITPCSVDSLGSLPSPIIPANDIDGLSAGIQLELSGHVVGQGCSELRAGECDGALSTAAAPVSGGNFALPISLTSVGEFELCALVVDDAGNIDGGALPVRVRVAPPAVAITSPSTGSHYNHANDLVDSTPTCEVSFTASCSEAGVPVQLRQGNSTLATASCIANVATFSSVSLSSRDDGSAASITARQTNEGLTGNSTAIQVNPDCHLPDIRFASSAHCGGQLSLTGNDANGGTPGLQYVISVLNDGVSNVVLGVTLGSGPEFFPSATPGSGAATFFTTNFGTLETTASLSACGSDAQGNANCAAPCSIVIADVPVVDISEPLNNAVLTLDDDDCDAAPGLQVHVHGTVDAADGSNVTISVGSTTTSTGISVASGEFDACVDASDDGPNKPLTVSVTDSARPAVPGTQSIFVSVDGNAPTATIAAPGAQVVERRAGIVRLSWPAVADVGGGPLAEYVLGCSRSEIEDDTDWLAATVRDIPLTPHTSGTETIDLDGFRTGVSQFCAVRGRDSGGSLTPLPPNPSTAIAVPFQTQVYSTVFNTPGALITSVAPIGDINGDGFSDIVYAMLGDGAQVFFGGTTPSTTPALTITGTDFLGMAVAGLGDINDDSRPDFAVSAVNGTDGNVYVFFGRALGVPWSDIDLSAGASCVADLCFHGVDPGALLGWDLNGGDFDGDGESDLLLGAPSADGGAGRVFVIRGGAQLVSGSDIDLPGSLPGNDPSGFIIEAGAGTSNFGISVSMVGAGLDGRGDLVIGANGAVNGDPGAALFVPGQAYLGPNLQTLTPPVPASIIASGASADFGNPVRALGDFNDDGTGDLALGISNGNGQCQVFTRSAGDAGYAGTHFTFDNDANDSVQWSIYLANARHPSLGLVGDLDDDDHGELLVGSFGSSGSADVFYGGAGVGSALRSEADFHFAAAGEGDVVPNFIGDINGDGFNDVAVIEFDPLALGTVTTQMTVLY